MSNRTIKIWVDDVRLPPSDEWLHMYTVDGTIRLLERLRELDITVEVMSMDHDAGSYAIYGGDYIKVLDWMERHGYAHPIHIHSMNPVGIINMSNICKHNGWVLLNTI